MPVATKIRETRDWNAVAWNSQVKVRVFGMQMTQFVTCDVEGMVSFSAPNTNPIANIALREKKL